MKVEQLVSELESKIQRQQEEIASLKARGLHAGQKYWYVPYVVLAFVATCAIIWAVIQ